jgi:hypothetical protein
MAWMFYQVTRDIYRPWSLNLPYVFWHDIWSNELPLQKKTFSFFVQIRKWKKFLSFSDIEVGY